MKDSVQLVLIVVFVLVCLILGLSQPFFESQTYNKLTGAKTTAWDAIWVELRVTDQCN